MYLRNGFIQLSIFPLIKGNGLASWFPYLLIYYSPGNNGVSYLLNYLGMLSSDSSSFREGVAYREKSS